VFLPFNRPHLTVKDLHYPAEAHSLSKLAGDGILTQKCHPWLDQLIGAQNALLIHFCKTALKVAIILVDIQPFSLKKR